MMVRRVAWLALGSALLLLLLSASVVGAQVVLPTDDSSGNGHDLTEVGVVEFGVESNVSKWGKGAQPGTDSFLRAADPEPLVVDGDLSVTGAYSAGTIVVVDARRGSSFQYHVVGDDDFFNFAYRTAAGTEERVFCSWDVKQGNVSFFVQRDVGALNTAVHLRAYGATGNQLCDVQESGLANPSVQLSGDFGFRVAQLTNEVYEARVWLSAVDVGTLDQVADPTVGSAREAEGTEEALWYLERFNEPGEATENNAVVVWSVPTVEQGSNITVYAEGLNESGVAVETVRAPQLHVYKVREPLSAPAGFRWNVSSLAWQTEASPVLMETQEAFGNETLWQATFEVPEETGRLVFVVWMPIEVPPVGEEEGPVEQNFTGMGEVEVVALDVEVQTAFEDFTALTGIEFAFLVGVTVVGIWLWSRSLEVVVRAFGAFLPLASGSLLLLFGVDQGLGSVWEGTVPLAAAMLLVGVGMVIKLFLEEYVEGVDGRRFL